MTDIKLYNTMTKTKEVFTPLDKDNVRMYVCGPTVYDRAHIGNARPVVVFDVLYRLLRHVYGQDQVTYARNFTDVDDKINAKAEQMGRSIRDITDETIGWFLDDMGALGALKPDMAPRATEYIPEMIAMIEELIEKGFAYPAEGHVLFRVKEYQNYGKLSRRSLDDMIAGARVEVAPYKENPMDFVMWKPSSGDQPGWESPWGYGRPGWHIECSAMAHKLFGEKFDIHGGGLDLQFPHHENEIAQSCACYGEDSFAQVWMHNEMLQVEGKKMSKSLGNFFSVRELLDQGYPGEVIRFVFLSTHYSKPMDWTEKKAREAEKTLREWYRVLHALNYTSATVGVLKEKGEWKPAERVIEVLKNDLNTHQALVEVMTLGSIGQVPELAASLEFLGLVNDWDNLGHMASIGLGPYSEMDLSVFAELMCDARAVAMSTKDFTKVDQLKINLLAAGVEVRMSKDGVELVPGTDFDPSKLEALK